MYDENISGYTPPPPNALNRGGPPQSAQPNGGLQAFLQSPYLQGLLHGATAMSSASPMAGGAAQMLQQYIQQHAQEFQQSQPMNSQPGMAPNVPSSGPY